ncbi:MAG TPA: DUF885 domain-containing protein [Steroidobacteraceae bacterium]|jgi:uncharacterized protein (DUF885 family)|nr:DUF885 domain-containing protein [Steroidobacteraceae bacterium]
MKHLNYLGCALGAAVLCGVQLARAAPSDLQFNQVVDDFVFGSLALSPVTASTVGYHQHKGEMLEDMLDDFSTAGLKATLTLQGDIEARIAKLDPKWLMPEQRADIEIMLDAIRATRLDIESVQSYRHNPTVYVELIGNALFTPYVLHYAPAEERYKHIVQRLIRIPELIRQAEQNLSDAPEIWNKVAREENAGNIDLIDGVLRAGCPKPLKQDYTEAAAPALIALRAFTAFLEGTLAKKTSDWRIGKVAYAKKFSDVLAIGKTPESLLKEAETDLGKTREEMVHLAAPKTVEQALAEVAAHHATPHTYMAAAKQSLAGATAFVREKDLVTLPPNANLQVIDTPVFMRGIYGAGGFNQAPALEPKLGAFFWVTPIPDSWPQARIDSKLREYNDSGLAHLTVHEAMPGHYVQAEYANHVQPRARRLLRDIFGNGPYVEGWAVYAQQLMADEGFLSDSPGYKLTLAKQMLRVLTNTILDVSLQTQDMTDAEAMELMTQGAYQETEEATAKLQRAKLSSCQLPAYYAGYKGWLAVSEHFKSTHGDAATLKQFHEAALREGAVPLPVLEELLN